VRQGGKGPNPSVQSHRGRAYCLISHVNACARGRGTRERVDVDALSLPRRKRKPRKLEQAAPRELTVGSRELPAAVADTRKRRGGRPRRERPASGPVKVSGATTHRRTFADRVAAPYGRASDTLQGMRNLFIGWRTRWRAMKLAETFQTRPSGVFRIFDPFVSSTRSSRLARASVPSSRVMSVARMATAFDRSTDIAAENGNHG